MKIYYCDQLPPDMSQHRLAYQLLERGLEKEYPDLFSEKPEYGKEELGKPYLKGYPWLHFNLSHCSSCVACAIGLESVGVDVEKRFLWRESLARRICHPSEWEFLQGIGGLEEKAAWLNRIWSRKESYLKCLGTGIRTDLRKLDTVSGPLLREYPVLEIQNERFTLCVCGKEENRETERLFL